jgi:hypothetical protein
LIGGVFDRRLETVVVGKTALCDATQSRNEDTIESPVVSSDDNDEEEEEEEA